MGFPKLDSFKKKVSDLPDKPNTQLPSAELKAHFDAAPEELRIAFNKLIDELEGPNAITFIPVDNAVGIPNGTLKEVLEYLKGQINNATLGQIIDGSITPVKLHADSKRATVIKIDDTDNRFEATDVEGALNELFLSASDVKSKVATAITGKGVPASSSDTGQELANKITQISTGKKSKNGTHTSGGVIYDNSSFSVTRLGFRPSHIMVEFKRWNSQWNEYHHYSAKYSTHANHINNMIFSREANPGKDSCSWAITDDGFTLTSSNFFSFEELKWIAFE
jgi:hypothetical protein